MNETSDLLDRFDAATVRGLAELDIQWQLDMVAELGRLAGELQMAFMRHSRVPWSQLAPTVLVHRARVATQDLISACQGYGMAAGKCVLGYGDAWVEATANVKLAIIGLQPYVDLVRAGLPIAAETDMTQLATGFQIESNLVSRWQIASRLRRLVVDAETQEIDFGVRVQTHARGRSERAAILATKYVDDVVGLAQGCSRALDEFMRGVDTALGLDDVPLSDRVWEQEADQISRHVAQTAAVTATMRVLLELLRKRPEYQFVTSVR